MWRGIPIPVWGLHGLSLVCLMKLMRLLGLICRRAELRSPVGIWPLRVAISLTEMHLGAGRSPRWGATPLMSHPFRSGVTVRRSGRVATGAGCFRPIERPLSFLSLPTAGALSFGTATAPSLAILDAVTELFGSRLTVLLLFLILPLTLTLRCVTHVVLLLFVID